MAPSGDRILFPVIEEEDLGPASAGEPLESLVNRPVRFGEAKEMRGERKLDALDGGIFRGPTERARAVAMNESNPVLVIGIGEARGPDACRVQIVDQRRARPDALLG